MMSVFTLLITNLFAQAEKTDTFKVYGNCGMCEKRIEKAAKVDGVTKALWNAESKIMTVSYNPDKVSSDAIQKNIADVGHDTEKYSADDKVYNELPGCCLYERKKENLANQSK
jgi:mercuric ion binding protein